MNQSVLFNDDHCFDDKRKAWTFTCQLQGQCLRVLIAEKYYPRTIKLSPNVIFTWEDQVENWLESNEPDSNQEIYLN